MGNVMYGVVYGIDERERGASRLLHEKLSTSRVGLRWERILRSHRPEIDSLMAVHPDLRRHVSDALRQVAEAGVGSRTLDELTVSSVHQVLDDLQRLGGFELKSAALGLQDELGLARGRSLDDVLAY